MHNGRFILSGLCVLFFVCRGIGQLTGSAYDTWSSLWVGQAANGMFGAADDPCTAEREIVPNRFPGPNGHEFIDGIGLWIGAMIEEDGYLTKRVSVALDGWLGINELWPSVRQPGYSDITEDSRRDTVDCWGNFIYNSDALADHEYAAVFCDTLTDAQYLEVDPIDGWHRPLGLKVTRTTHSMIDPPCNQVCWIRYRIQNIGSNFLKNLYIAHFVEPHVSGEEISSFWDDLVGFEASQEIAYFCDNDGRRGGDGSGNDFVAPHAIGLMFLGERLYNQKASFNWWRSHGNPNSDYGPCWRRYAEQDSAGLGWTGTYGTPMGDVRKYQLMGNGEQDFDQVMTRYIWGLPPQPTETGPQQWWTVGLPDDLDNLSNGHHVRFLHSFGPAGIPDYMDQHGRWIFRLNPGEQFDVWVAMIGGLDFHNPDYPQPNDTSIDRSLFDFTDLLTQAGIARSLQCVEWLDADQRPEITLPATFALEPVYPNPFNAAATVRLRMDAPATVTIMAYDVLGREAARIAHGPFAAGSHSLTWNAAELPSGLYFIEAKTAFGARAVQKAALLK